MKTAVRNMLALVTLSLPLSALGAVKADQAQQKNGALEAMKEQTPKGSPSNLFSKAGAGNTEAAGKVVETMEGGSYRYVNLEKGGKRKWVAFPAQDVAPGDELSFKGCVEMSGFQSKTLNRRFDTVLFCEGPEQKVRARTAKGAEPLAKKPAAAAEKISVEKAGGPSAYTVAEIFARSAALQGKKVTVRGKVVKVATSIMNRNWIHIQDGSGDGKKKTNDLVVTSQDSPAEGDVVTVTGILAKDRDFGSGYKYSAIIEHAKVQK